MLTEIDAARQTICLESYTFSESALGERFRDGLIRAQQRGVRVRVLVDALGSVGLSGNFWDPLRLAGGEARQFNPLALRRLGFRNHRKLLVCDSQVAFVGGFNIAPEYEGDGITCGWCDVGVRVEGALAAQLETTFEEMFERAEFRHKRFMRLRRFSAKRTVGGRNEQLLLSGPGRGRSPILRALRKDLTGAKNVQIVMAYFLPTWRLRRDLTRAARRGARVQLVLAGKSDVAVSQLAGRSLYRRLLRAGVEISEYEPQILHAKLMIVDDAVYVGSANLDPRSLQINYELMIRFEGRGVADEARRVFAGYLQHSRAIGLPEWRKARTFWMRLKQRWAYFLLVRLDPYLARWQWRILPD